MSNPSPSPRGQRITTLSNDGEPIRFQREPDGSIVVSTVIPPTSRDFALWEMLERTAVRFAEENK